MPYTHDRNWGCRINDEYLFRGGRMLVMENELLRVSILLDKGTDIYEFLYKPRDIDFMWRSPMPVRDSSRFVPSIPREDGFFQDYYFGGWQEIFPNGGAHLEYKGAEMGQHGEVSLLPWKCAIVQDTPEEISAKMWTRTYRTPFYIEKTMLMRTGEAILHIEEKIVNEGMEEMRFMWGHHPAFGAPFLDESCRIDAPATKVEVHSPLNGDGYRLAEGAAFDSFPIVKDKNGNDFDLSAVPPPNARECEMAYLLGLSDGWYALTNTNRKVGFAMKWDKEIFPVIWLWEVFGGSFGYPWYGRTYNLALEPFTSHPGGMAAAMKKGTVPTIGAGETIETKLSAIAYEGLERVKNVSENGVVE